MHQTVLACFRLGYLFGSLLSQSHFVELGHGTYGKQSQPSTPQRLERVTKPFLVSSLANSIAYKPELLAEILVPLEVYHAGLLYCP